MTARVVFNIDEVSVIVAVPRGPSSSKLLGQAGPPPARQAPSA